MGLCMRDVPDNNFKVWISDKSKSRQCDSCIENKKDHKLLIFHEKERAAKKLAQSKTRKPAEIRSSLSDENKMKRDTRRAWEDHQDMLQYQAQYGEII